MLEPLKKLFPSADDKLLKSYWREADAIERLGARWRDASDGDLRGATDAFRERLQAGEDLIAMRPEVFAVMREAADRVLGLRHFPSQLIGGMVLSEGNIAEMPTGEGKTLVASLPAYLRALEGKGVHVITVNDYLAKRDCEQIGRVHSFLGLTVGLNVADKDPSEKQDAYRADITYGVGVEFGFDYLRDNMAYRAQDRVQRPFHFALVDEVDSVLIDEAKTPLIIAGKTDVHANLSALAAKLVKTFKAETDYIGDTETKTVNYTEQGIEKIERFFALDNLYDIEHQTLYHYMIQALRARVLFQRDVDYIVKEGKVLLVDMFTGRIMDGRSLSNGLHQAIEAKEGLELTEENKTQASITIQNYFRLYPKLAGMTGTAKTEEKEFRDLYNMSVIQVPTNRPIARTDKPFHLYKTRDDKYRAVAKRARAIHATGQPILLGTTSILQSERVSEFLRDEGVPHEVLNAKTVEQEISLISLAGQRGAVTVATNMAGRGTDIMLGEGVAELGGLFVLGTELHESRRIDNQLKGRSGRQGDPGASEFYISLEDEMFGRYAGPELERLLPKLQAAPDGEVTDKRAIEFCERTQRICEGANFGVREYNLKLDNVMGVQRKTIYELRDMLIFGEAIEDTFLKFLDEFPKHEVRFFFDRDDRPTEDELQALQDGFRDLIPGSTWPSWEGESNPDRILRDVQRNLEAFKPVVHELLQKGTNLDQVRLYLIGVVDRRWLDHIDAMDKLKEGIGMRGYAQEDPMRQYEREAFALFTRMIHAIGKDVFREIANLLASLAAERAPEQDGAPQDPTALIRQLLGQDEPAPAQD